MTGLMIVTLLVAVLACGAVFVLVDVLTTGIMKRMKKEVFRHIKQYNDIMQDTTAATVEEDKEAKQEYAGFRREEQLAVPFLPSVRPMRKADFFSDYRKIREAFSVDSAEVIRTIPQNGQEQQVCYETAVSILEKLSFEVLYRISGLSSKSQLEVLDEILEEREAAMLAEYVEVSGKEFDCTEFHTYVKSMKAKNDDTVYCYVAPGRTAESGAVIVDDALCEGFQLLHGNLLYDYGLRSSEIS